MRFFYFISRVLQLIVKASDFQVFNEALLSKFIRFFSFLSQLLFTLGKLKLSFINPLL